MASDRVFNPAFSPATTSGAESQRSPLAGGLQTKRIGLIANAWPSWVEMADRLEQRLRSTFPGVDVHRYLVPNGSAAAPELIDEIARDNDGAIVGLANCGSCTAWSFHDSAELMRAGLPVTWVASSEFDGLAHALAEARRVPVPIVVLPTNPETIPIATALQMADAHFETIVDSLVDQAASAVPPGAESAVPQFLELKPMGSADDLFYDEGLTDGLPIIVPTFERVVEMAGDGADLDEVIGYLPPTYFPVTRGALAANAVMAGCDPRYLPALEAIVAAACVHEFNMNGIATTTGPSTPMVVVNGPVRRAIDINCERGFLGPGRRSNATIGRAFRLIINNIGGAKPGTISKSIMGQPGRYSFCFGEDEERSPWEPLHASLGFAPGESAVTLVGATGTMNILTPRQDPKAMITLFADGLANMGNPNIMMGKGTVAVLITSGHADVLARAGYSKADVAAEIAAQARIPLDRFPEGLRPDPPYEFIERNGYVHAVHGGENVYVIVAGGPEPTHATVVPSHPSCVPVSRAIA
jgi:hypothetical protein